MTTKLERIRKAARDRFTPEQREPWEFAWARVFEALPEYCEDVDALRIILLQAALDGLSVAEGEAMAMKAGCTVPPCPVPAAAAIPPCPVTAP